MNITPQEFNLISKKAAIAGYVLGVVLIALVLLGIELRLPLNDPDGENFITLRNATLPFFIPIINRFFKTGITSEYFYYRVFSFKIKRIWSELELVECTETQLTLTIPANSYNHSKRIFISLNQLLPENKSELLKFFKPKEKSK